jgi:hypothetical protein
VFSDATKFLVPISAFEGEPLVYPKDDPMGRKGKQINYTEPGSQGVIWWNEITNEYQGLQTDGSRVLIANEVTHEAAKSLEKWISDHVGTPDKFNSKTILEFIKYTRHQAGQCVYPGRPTSFMETVEVVKELETGIEHYGLFQRRKDQESVAMYVPHDVNYRATGKEPQNFATGAVVVRTTEGKFRAVKPSGFMSTYKLAPDGAQIVLDKLPQQNFNR